MKLSTEIGSVANITGEERAVELIAKAGFDAWDFSLFEMAKMDWANNCVAVTNHPLRGSRCLEFARRLKRVGIDNGIVCNQSHAPFPARIKEIMDVQKLAIECTAEAGGKTCVIHPHVDKTPEENALLFNELLPFAKECNVKLAAENMFRWNKDTKRPGAGACGTAREFLKQLEIVNDDCLVACLDIGHAEMIGDDASAPEMIRALGGHLQALHVHDNDHITDCHQIPFSMNIDFASVANALKSINYTGYITLEACEYLNGYNENNVFDGVKKLYESARRLSDMIES